MSGVECDRGDGSIGATEPGSALLDGSGPAGLATVVGAMSAAAMRALNTAARDHVHAQGQLGDDVDYGPLTAAVGDRIICRRD